MKIFIHLSIYLLLVLIKMSEKLFWADPQESAQKSTLMNSSAVLSLP